MRQIHTLARPDFPWLLRISSRSSSRSRIQSRSLYSLYLLPFGPVVRGGVPELKAPSSIPDAACPKTLPLPGLGEDPRDQQSLCRRSAAAP
ncbi:MAG: hypothetical protein ACK56F_12610, partial [bacterium]